MTLFTVAVLIGIFTAWGLLLVVVAVHGKDRDDDSINEFTNMRRVLDPENGRH